MSSDWMIYKLEDCLDAIIDYRGKTPEKTTSGIPLITAKVIKNGRIEKPTEFIAIENYDSWMRRGLPNCGDIVLTVEAPLGKVAQLGCEIIALAQRVVTLRGKKNLLNSTYLLYWLQSEPAQEQLKARATGTTVIGIKQSELRKVEIPIPPLAYQVEIAEMLSTLDDRITLLRETNTTLEAIAQALFKSWFIDFDPVHAKMQGQSPEGMDEATAALFPDSFEETEFGTIPRGWATIPFRSSINVIGGGTPKTSTTEFWNGNIPWFSVVDAPLVSDVFVVNTEKKITLAGLNGSSTKLLAEGTTIISARGTVGRLALTGCPMAMNQSCYGLRGKADDQFFTFYSTKRLVEQLKQRAHGSVFDTITQETFEGVDVCYPKVNLIYSFEQCVEPLMKRIKNNLLKVNTLNTIRNTLLPKLISGEITLTQISI